MRLRGRFSKKVPKKGATMHCSQSYLKKLSSNTTAKLKKKKQPKWLGPMFGKLSSEYFSDKNWIYERKLDGERCLVFKDKDRVTLFSRNKKNLNIAYPELVEQFKKQKETNFIVDGELVVFEGKETSFAKLQNRMNLKNIDKVKNLKSKVYIYLFDILYLAGYDTTGLSLLERKSLLKKALKFQRSIRYTPHIKEKGVEYFHSACKKGWEGVMAKRSDAPYQHKRSCDWLKFKCSQGQELVVVGYTDPQGSRIGFGALLVGYYQNGILKYAGKVGTGYNEKFLGWLIKKLQKLECKSPPFKDASLPKKGVHWVRPVLVAEIGFAEWTKDHKLRQPRFLGLRDDVNPKDVVKERSGKYKT